MPGTALARVIDAPPSTALARAPEFNLADVMRLAEMLLPIGMLPDHIKSPGAAVAIILTGRELGMDPMRALRSLNLVKGKVTENADSQLARFKSDGGRAKWITLDETKGVLFLKHPNGDEHTETFTMQDAERAGLTKPSYKGEPSMFTKYPKAMIRSRTITAGLKSIGWEGGTGTYDPEELVVPDTAASQAEEEHELTLEEALNVPLRGAANKWGGNGGKPLAEVPAKVIAAALEFFGKKLLESEVDNPALTHQVRALELVHDWRTSEGADDDRRDVDEETAVSEDDVREAGTLAEQLDAAADAEDAAEAVRMANTPKPARPIPEDLAELKRWSLAEIQATLLATLKLPAFAKSRSGFLEQINPSLTHHQAQGMMKMLVDMIASAAAARANKPEKGSLGKLPGGV